MRHLITRLSLLRAAPLLLLLALAACAGGPVEGTRPLGQAEVRSNWIAGTKGTGLALYSWQANGTPRAIILALHGFGDSGYLTYDAAARAWAAEGIKTYAYDQRGFGQNPSRQQWPGVNVLVEDLQIVAAALKARHRNVPLVVVGHSMGGGVTLTAAGRGLAADGIVLAAPAIIGLEEVNPLLRLGAWGIGLIAADQRFTGNGVVRLVPTDNREALRRVAGHPNHFANPSGRELLGLLRLTDRAAAFARQVTIPSLTLVGLKDEIVDASSAIRVQESIGGDARLITYEEGWHWLFRDRQAPRVWADTAAFALSLDPVRAETR